MDGGLRVSELFLNSFGAFAGAFFAFLFLRLGEFLTKLYERQVKHYNSLVNLETQLNEIGGVVHDNLYVIPKFIQAIKSGHVYFNNLHTLNVDKRHYEDLYNISLINELFSYNYHLRKANDDIGTLTSGYQEIKNAFIQKNISLEDYKVNTEILSENLAYLEKFLVHLKDETVTLIALVRIHMKHDQPLGAKLMGQFLKSLKYVPEENDIKIEVKKIQNEIKDSEKKSRDQLEKIFS